MQYKEEIRDLFSVSKDYYLAHCISADFGMGKGIAVEFNKKFEMKRILKGKYPDFINDYRNNKLGGTVLIERQVINLITKERYWQKPTYDTLQAALNAAKSQATRLQENCYANYRLWLRPVAME